MDNNNFDGGSDNGYQSPNYDQQAAVPDRKGMAVASLVLGIISVVLFCLWYLSLPCAVVGLILGIMSLKSSGRGMAIAGLVISIVTLVITVLLFVLAAIGISILNDAASGINWSDFDF
ncbi:MAG TPA: DUF4190 domain-containing protein [Bacillota bacterium]|nr:DUF4190 domain-containing protein [Bacillota bacterium]